MEHHHNSSVDESYVSKQPEMQKNETMWFLLSTINANYVCIFK